MAGPTVAGSVRVAERVPAMAQASGIAQVEFAVHDVMTLPFPAGPADLIYCRMLLAHLPDPVSVVRSWASQLTANGVLLVDEIEWIRTSHPCYGPICSWLRHW